MITLQTKPAIIQMLDHRRGDLFVVISDDAHYVVQVEDPLWGSDDTVGRFRPGHIALDEIGEPACIWLQTFYTATRCTPVPCRTTCPACGALMAVEDDKFTCSECHSTLD